MRLVLPVIAALVLPSICFADASPHATVAGEVDTPGRFVVTKAATLSSVFSEITKPLAMGATSRVRVYRNGTRRDYDLKRFGDVGIVEGDIVEVPIKYVSEEQSENRVESVFCQDSKAFMRQVEKLKSDRWKVRTNWRDGIQGVEFRPTAKNVADGGLSVFVRVANPAELATTEDQKLGPVPKNSHAVLVICRDPGRGVDPSEFELALVAQIRAIPNNPNHPSEQDAPSNGG